MTASQTEVDEESQEEDGGQAHGWLELRSGGAITGCFIMTANLSILSSALYVVWA